MDEWVACISKHPELRRPRARTITNPFTNAPFRYVPTPDKANIVEGAAPAGAIEASSEFETDGQLLVYSNDRRKAFVRKIARRIARSLGAQLLWFPDPLIRLAPTKSRPRAR